MPKDNIFLHNVTKCTEILIEPDILNTLFLFDYFQDTLTLLLSPIIVRNTFSNLTRNFNNSSLHKVSCNIFLLWIHASLNTLDLSFLKELQDAAHIPKLTRIIITSDDLENKNFSSILSLDGDAVPVYLNIINVQNNVAIADTFQLNPEHKHKSFQRKTFALLYSGTTGEAEDAKNCSCTSEDFHKQIPARCYTSHITLNILATKLNISWTPTDDATLVFDNMNDILNSTDDNKLDSFPILHLCILCHPYEFFDEIKDGNPLVYIDHQRFFNMVYCNKRQIFEPPSFKMLTRPFDIWTWFLIILMALFVSLIYKDLSHAENIYRILIFQPPLKVTRLRGFLLLHVLILFLSLNYLDVITTYMMAPLEEKQLETNQQLFSSKVYRIVTSDNMFLTKIIQDLEIPEKYWKTALLVDKKFNLGKLATNPLEVFQFLTLIKGATAMPSMNNAKELLERGYRFRFKNVSCSLVKNSTPVKQSFWILRLNHAHASRLVLERILESGINTHWSEFNNKKKVSRKFASGLIISNMTRADLIGNVQPIPLMMKASPQIIFYTLLCFLAAALFIFSYEVLLEL